MTYQVGQKVDLSHINPPRMYEKQPPIKRSYAKYLAGTKVRFLTMKDMIVMDITEPPIALRVAIM